MEEGFDDVNTFKRKCDVVKIFDVKYCAYENNVDKQERSYKNIILKSEVVFFDTSAISFIYFV